MVKTAISKNLLEEKTPADRQPISERLSYDMKVADAVWVATALLHIQNPDNNHVGFTTEQIAKDVEYLRLTRATRSSIWQHVNQHCVANREPNPNRTRMLYALGKGNRRLFREGVDDFKPARAGSPTYPTWSELPNDFQHLRRWYEEEWNPSPDPLTALAGTWTFGNAEEYLRELREGWD